jgi:hypothetical protein
MDGPSQSVVSWVMFERPGRTDRIRARFCSLCLRLQQQVVEKRQNMKTRFALKRLVWITSSYCRGHDMTLALQPRRGHFAKESLDQRDPAEAMRGKRPVRAFSAAPFVFVAVVLFATNVWIATRLQGESERALFFATFGSAGMPMFQWTSLACGPAPGGASSARLGHTEMLALLGGD